MATVGPAGKVLTERAIDMLRLSPGHWKEVTLGMWDNSHPGYLGTVLT